MSESRGRSRTAAGLAGIGLAVLAVGVGYYGYDWYRLREGLRGDDPREAQVACYEVTDRGDKRFLDDLIGLLGRADHDDVREAAGYALARIGDARAAGPLAAAVERQDDDIIRAKLITYWSRLAGEAAEPTLRKWVSGPEVWRAAGAAVALLARGQAEPAEVLFDQAGCDEPQRRQYCAHELTKFAGPMSEMVGAGLTLTTDGQRGFSAEQIAALRHWWSGPRTPQRLRDHLAWHAERTPPRWRLIKRMLHARERAEGWVGLRRK